MLDDTLSSPALSSDSGASAISSPADLSIFPDHAGSVQPTSVPLSSKSFHEDDLLQNLLPMPRLHRLSDDAPFATIESEPTLGRITHTLPLHQNADAFWTPHDPSLPSVPSFNDVAPRSIPLHSLFSFDSVVSSFPLENSIESIGHPRSNASDISSQPVKMPVLPRMAASSANPNPSLTATGRNDSVPAASSAPAEPSEPSLNAAPPNDGGLISATGNGGATSASGEAASTSHALAATSSATVRNASVPRREGSNLVIACRQCRARKIRCDSTRPSCHNCVRRQSSCAYDAVPRRRGPDKRPGTRQRSCKKRSDLPAGGIGGGTMAMASTPTAGGTSAASAAAGVSAKRKKPADVTAPSATDANSAKRRRVDEKEKYPAYSPYGDVNAEYLPFPPKSQYMSPVESKPPFPINQPPYGVEYRPGPSDAPEVKSPYTPAGQPFGHHAPYHPGFDARAPGYDGRVAGYDARAPVYDGRGPIYDGRSPGYPPSYNLEPTPAPYGGVEPYSGSPHPPPGPYYAGAPLVPYAPYGHPSPQHPSPYVPPLHISALRRSTPSQHSAPPSAVLPHSAPSSGVAPPHSAGPSSAVVQQTALSPVAPYPPSIQDVAGASASAMPGAGVSSSSSLSAAIPPPPVLPAPSSEHRMFPDPPPAVLAKQMVWWDSFLRSYSLKNIVADISFLLSDSGSSAFLTFIYFPMLRDTLYDGEARLRVQPALVLAAVALATLMRSSQATMTRIAQAAKETGPRDNDPQNSSVGAGPEAVSWKEAGRERARWFRNSAQDALENMFSSDWRDTGLAQAAAMLVLYESSAHPEYNPKRLADALVWLDKIVCMLGLMRLDEGPDPPRGDAGNAAVRSEGVCRFAERAVPSVYIADPSSPPRHCRCPVPADMEPQTGSGEHPAYTSREYMLPWDPSWTRTQIRDEECRRTAWSALALASAYTAQCAALHRDVSRLFVTNCANYAILFPGEALEPPPTVSSESSSDNARISPRESIWALYCRSMLLWNFCNRVPKEGFDHEQKAEIAQEAWNEVQAIEDALDCHTCNLDTTLIYMTREYIINTRLSVTQLLRCLQGLDAEVAASPGPLFNRKQAEEWISAQDEVFNRINLSLHTHLQSAPHTRIAGRVEGGDILVFDGHELAKRPFMVPWFVTQLSICLAVWSRDRNIVRALELGRLILSTVDVANALWPCDYISRLTTDLRTQLEEANRSVSAPPVSPIDMVQYTPSIGSDVHPNMGTVNTALSSDFRANLSSAAPGLSPTANFPPPELRRNLASGLHHA